MHSLVNAIAQHLKHSQIFLNQRINHLSYKNKSWQIEHSLYDEVFVTTSAPVASKILATVHSTISSLISQIAFKSAGIVTLTFKQVDITLNENISGILLPVEDFPAFSAITFSSNKWTNRTASDKALLRLYLRDTPLLKEPEKFIVYKAIQSLQQLVPVKSKPLKHQYNQWHKSRPLYKIGHQKIISDIQKILLELPGLHLTGCSYKGSGVASLVHQAKELTTCNKSEKIMKDNQQEITNYLAANNLKAESTASGLHYIITREGDGNHPSASDQVRVDYKGYFTDGKTFDSSYDRGESISFGLNQVISGWTEGIPLLSKGGAGTFLIPSHLGYGSMPQRGIPANTVLIFDVELHDF